MRMSKTYVYELHSHYLHTKTCNNGDTVAFMPFIVLSLSPANKSTAPFRSSLSLNKYKSSWLLDRLGETLTPTTTQVLRP